MRKLFFLLFVALLATNMIAGQGTTLVYGTTEKVSDMDTASAYDFHTWEIFQNINQGLLTFEPGTTKVIPGLAEKYTVSSDGTTYDFTLRKGLTFSDGTPLDAQVVKWTLDRCMALKADPSWLLTDFVKEVVAVNQQTVRIVLQGARSFFPTMVAGVPPYFPLNPNSFPVDKIIKDPSELKGGVLTGLGPYKAISFKRDEEVVLEANPNFYGKAPAIKRIIIRYFADATTMRLALEKGDIDLAYKTMNPSDIKDLSANKKINTYKLPGPYIRYLAFNTDVSVFNKKELRQVLAALVNRPSFNQKVYLGQNEPLYSMVPKGIIYAGSDFKTAFGDANVKLAEAGLSKLGYSKSNPFTFDLWYTPSRYGDTEVNLAEVLKADFEKTPLIKVNLKSAEWATYRKQWQDKQMGVFLLGWYPDYLDPDNYTAAFAGTNGSTGLGIFFSNKEWDGWFEQEQGEKKPAVREKLFQKIQKAWTVEVPTVPLFQGNLFVFTKPIVKGVKIGPTLIFNYDQLTMQK